MPSTVKVLNGANFIFACATFIFATTAVAGVSWDTHIIKQVPWIVASAESGGVKLTEWSNLWGIRVELKPGGGDSDRWDSAYCDGDVANENEQSIRRTRCNSHKLQNWLYAMVAGGFVFSTGKLVASLFILFKPLYRAMALSWWCSLLTFIFLLAAWVVFFNLCYSFESRPYGTTKITNNFGYGFIAAITGCWCAFVNMVIANIHCNKQELPTKQPVLHGLTELGGPAAKNPTIAP